MQIPIAQKYFDEAENFRENRAFKKAIDSYRKALEVDPSFISAYYNLALLYHQTQQLDDAIINLKKVIELDPSDASAFNNLGVLCFSNDNLIEAKIYFEKALSIDANYKEAGNNLEKVRQKTKAQIQFFLEQPTKVVQDEARLKVGFVSIWFERGQSYVTKILRDVVARKHKTFVFARTGGVYGQPKLEIHGYWDVPNLTAYPDYQIPPAILTKWIQGNNLDMVIFNEEYDWNLVMAAKATGIKIATYLDYYKEDWKPYMNLYDAVLCSTKRTFHLVKDFCKAYYIGWGIDTDLFKLRDDIDRKYTFFHNAGWLGINYRKMTPAVITAFEAISRYNTDVTLFIHAQVEIEQLPPEVVNMVRNNSRITYHVETVPAPGLYHKGSILLFPSKLEGLGLPLLEGMACGLPAIATDAPPMNEFVQDGNNGFLVKVIKRLTRQDNIAFPEEIIAMEDLISKMDYLSKNPELIKRMGKNARNSVNNYGYLREKINGVINQISICHEEKPNAIPTVLPTNGIVEIPFTYSQEWYDKAYHISRIGVDWKKFSTVNLQYEQSGYRARWERVLDEIQVPSRSIEWLEVGCHLGLTTYWTAEKFPQVRFHMFDFSQEAVSWCKQQFPFPDRTVVWQGSVEYIQLPHNDLTELFDFVSCIDVTEHLPPPIYKAMIEELRRVLKPGGYLILMQGNAPNVEHIHILPENELVADFLAAGFDLVKCLPYRHYLLKRSLCAGSICQINSSQ